MKQIQNLKNTTHNPPSLSPKAAQSKIHSTLILSAMCLALFMTNFNATAADVALPQMQQNLGADMLGVQWILNAYLLPVASLLLVTGKLGDVYGRKRIFLAGVLLFTAATTLCGLAPNLEILIIGRGLQGIGAAAIIPLSLTIVTATFSDHQARAKAIGIWSAVSAIALVAGPGLGGFLVDGLSWRSIFLVTVPLGLVTFAMTAGAFKEQQRAKEDIDFAGLGLSVVAIAALVYVLTQGSVAAWQTSRTFVLVILTGLSFTAFWQVNARSSHPVVPPTLFKNRKFITLCCVQTLVFFTSGGLFFLLSLFLQQVQGYSAAATGLCFIPMNFAIVTASFASGWIAAKLGWRFPILSGLAIASIAIFSLTRIGIDTPYTTTLTTLIFSGFGGGLTIAPLAAAVMNSVKPIEEGIASAVSSISIQFGGILGIGLQGALFSERLNSALSRTVLDWDLPAALKSEIIAGGVQNLSQLPSDLPVTLQTTEIVQQAVKSAFVSGLQSVVWVAALSLLLGLLLVLTLIPSKSVHPNTLTSHTRKH